MLILHIVAGLARCSHSLDLVDESCRIIHISHSLRTGTHSQRSYPQVLNTLSSKMSTASKTQGGFVPLSDSVFDGIGQLLDLVEHVPLLAHELLDLRGGMHDRGVVTSTEFVTDLGQ